jgi:hypothetical protein
MAPLVAAALLALLTHGARAQVDIGVMLGELRFSVLLADAQSTTFAVDFPLHFSTPAMWAPALPAVDVVFSAEFSSNGTSSRVEAWQWVGFALPPGVAAPPAPGIAADFASPCRFNFTVPASPGVDDLVRITINVRAGRGTRVWGLGASSIAARARPPCAQTRR